MYLRDVTYECFIFVWNELRISQISYWFKNDMSHMTSKNKLEDKFNMLTKPETNLMDQFLEFNRIRRIK